MRTSFVGKIHWLLNPKPRLRAGTLNGGKKRTRGRSSFADDGICLREHAKDHGRMLLKAAMRLTARGCVHDATWIRNSGLSSKSWYQAVGNLASNSPMPLMMHVQLHLACPLLGERQRALLRIQLHINPCRRGASAEPAKIISSSTEGGGLVRVEQTANVFQCNNNRRAATPWRRRRKRRAAGEGRTCAQGGSGKTGASEVGRCGMERKGCVWGCDHRVLPAIHAWMAMMAWLRLLTRWQEWKRIDRGKP